MLRELPFHRNIRVIGSSGGACAGSFLFLPEVRLQDRESCLVASHSGHLVLHRAGHLHSASTRTRRQKVEGLPRFCLLSESLLV